MASLISFCVFTCRDLYTFAILVGCWWLWPLGKLFFPVGCVLKLDHIVLTYTVYISSCVVLVKRICLMVSVPAFFQTLKAVLFALRGIPGGGKGVDGYHTIP